MKQRVLRQSSSHRPRMKDHFGLKKVRNRAGNLCELVAVLIVSTTLFACAIVPPSYTPVADRSLGSSHHPALDPRLYATLWQQSSAEYRVLAEMIFSTAKFQLERALADREWTAEPSQKVGFQHLPPAVIMDIDETVMDNSRFQAQLIKTGLEYSEEVWKRWVGNRTAASVPGAVDFVTFAQARGITVFFITGRDYYHEKETRLHLRSIGIDLPEDKDTVLMRGEQKDWVSDKTSRRKFVADAYRVLLVIGDDLGDFTSAHKTTPQSRIKEAIGHREWGTKWFILPNPSYGSWLESLHDFNFKMTREEILKRKFDNLKFTHE